MPYNQFTSPNGDVWKYPAIDNDGKVSAMRLSDGVMVPLTNVGPAGEPGPAGATGPAGPQGEPGSDGSASSVHVYTVTSDPHQPSPTICWFVELPYDYGSLFYDETLLIDNGTSSAAVTFNGGISDWAGVRDRIISELQQTYGFTASIDNSTGSLKVKAADNSAAPITLSGNSILAESDSHYFEPGAAALTMAEGDIWVQPNGGGGKVWKAANPNGGGAGWYSLA